MKTIIQLFDRLLQRYMPDPFVIAILLTAFTFALACFATGDPAADNQLTPEQIIQFWGDGFWNLAAFTLQMSMILIGGYVVATSRPVTMLLQQLVKLANGPVSAVLFCTFAAMIASWINWGLGLVVGGIVALEVGKRLPQVSFRVLVASSYSGFLVWHAGLSGSVPLDLNTENSKVSGDLIGELIPLSQTTFSPINLTALACMLVLLPLVNLFHLRMSADDEQAQLQPTDTAVEPSTRDQETEIWINRSFISVLLLLAMAAFYWYVVGTAGNFKLSLNSVIFIFFMLGLLLHGTPNRFMEAVTDATPKVAPILIQYPLYAGIMAILIKSGLADQISNWFVEHASKETFPLMTFYSAGLLNLLVPSGGGQWAVQAPIVVNAANELGVEIPKVAMAVAWGDAWTNMAQPFWAIPLLTIAGLRIKDIIGFCLLTLFASGVVLSLIFLVL